MAVHNHRIRKVVLIGGNITCLLILSTLGIGLNASSAKMFTYNDPHFGTKVQYPSDWKFSIDKGEPTFYPPGSGPSEVYSASLWFSKRNLNESTGIGYYLNYSRDYYNNYPGIKVDRAVSNITLDGNPAYLLEWTTTDVLGREFRTMKVGTIIGTEEYYITYYATKGTYLQYLPIVQKMLSSFKIELAEKNIPYITILPTVWSNDKLDVYVVVEPKSKLVSSKYVPDAIAAINKWSELLKQNSNNSNAWNFDVHVKTESLSKNERYQFEERFSPPANIILELKAETQDVCNMLGESIPPVDNNRFSVYSYAFTSCAGIELPHEVVYSTVLHEFAHDLGLGHAYYKNGDLMCSGEKDKHEHQFITCDSSQQLREVPSDLNIQGLLYRYGTDGFDTPNKKLKGEEPRFYQKFALGVNIDNKTRIDRLLTVGWTLDDYGKTDEALQYFDKALAINENDADSIYAKAYALKTLKMYEQAIPYYDRALAIDPKDADSLYGKGHALEGLGKSEEAITYYDKALAIDPNDVDSLYNKGEILFKSGKYQEALTYYDRILSINPSDSDAATRKNDTMLMLIR